LKALVPVEGSDVQISIEHEVLAPLRRFMLLDSAGVVPAGAPPVESGSAAAVVRGSWFTEVQKSGLETVCIICIQCIGQTFLVKPKTISSSRRLLSQVVGDFQRAGPLFSR
jgi:hypothetical protein